VSAAGAGAIAAGAALAAAAGGKVAFVPRRSGDAGALAAGLAPGVLPGGRLLSDAADRAEVEAVWGPLPADLVAGASASDAAAGLAGRLAGGLADILRAAADGGIDVLHLAGVDLVRDAASASLAEAALARVAAQGTVVVQDLAMTETVARFADVVLPVTATQERAGTRTDWEGRAQRFSRAVDGPKLTQDDWEAFVQLAALLGHDLGVRGLDDIRAAAGPRSDGARARTRCPTVDAAAASPSSSDAGAAGRHARRGRAAAAARRRDDARRRRRPARDRAPLDRAGRPCGRRASRARRRSAGRDHRCGRHERRAARRGRRRRHRRRRRAAPHADRRRRGADDPPGRGRRERARHARRRVAAEVGA
jgi:NADH-quinone oxidoreductase subunit G